MKLCYINLSKIILKYIHSQSYINQNYRERIWSNSVVTVAKSPLSMQKERSFRENFLLIIQNIIHPFEDQVKYGKISHNTLLILWPPDGKSQLIGKDADAGKDCGQEKGVKEDELVGQHHQLNEPEFEKTPRDSEGQGSLVYCSPWGCKESDRTQQLNNNMDSNMLFLWNWYQTN